MTDISEHGAHINALARGVPSMTYLVNDIYPSIQGEGMHAGTPVIFVRLMGCPVGCAFCDTKETWEAIPAQQVSSFSALEHGKPFWLRTDAESIGARCSLVAGEANIAWVVLTGGEPAEQYLPPLVQELHDCGYKVALETSGTAQGHIPNTTIAPPPNEPWDRPDWVTVSPKVNMPGGRALRAAAIHSAHEVKWVVGRRRDIDNLKEFLVSFPVREDAVISLQPMSQSEKATALCVETCMREGWRLSLQLHKYLQLP